MATESYTPSSFEDKLGASEPRYEIVNLKVPQQSTLDFEADGQDNPRTWSPKKKVAIGGFVLLAAFVA
jgi:hypothetical protein